MQTIPGSHAESRFGRKETQEKRALYASSRDKDSREPNPGSYVRLRSARRLRYKKGHLCKSDRHMENRNLGLVWHSSRRREEKGRNREKKDQELEKEGRDRDSDCGDRWSSVSHLTHAGAGTRVVAHPVTSPSPNSPPPLPLLPSPPLLFPPRPRGPAVIPITGSVHRRHHEESDRGPGARPRNRETRPSSMSETRCEREEIRSRSRR